MGYRQTQTGHTPQNAALTVKEFCCWKAMDWYCTLWGKEDVDVLPAHFPCSAEEVLLGLIFSSAVLILHAISTLRNLQKNQQNRLLEVLLEALAMKLRIRMDQRYRTFWKTHPQFLTVWILKDSETVGDRWAICSVSWGRNGT